MSCPVLNLEVCQGETFRRTLVYKDSNEIPVDIDAWSGTFRVGTDVYTSDGDEITIGPEAGTIHLMLTTNQVAALPSATVKYLVTLSNPAFPAGQGDVTILKGRLEVE
jgi:hypothetical protein